LAGRIISSKEKPITDSMIRLWASLGTQLEVLH